MELVFFISIFTTFISLFLSESIFSKIEIIFRNTIFEVTHGYLMWGRRWLKMKLIEREEKKLEKKEGLEGKEILIEDRIPDGLTKEVTSWYKISQLIIS